MSIILKLETKKFYQLKLYLITINQALTIKLVVISNFQFPKTTNK